MTSQINDRAARINRYRLQLYIVLCSVLISFFFCPGLFAQGNGAHKPKQVYVVIVGVSEYSDKKNNLNYAEADARKMYRKMVKLGVPESNIGLLTNEAATKTGITSSITQLFYQAGPQDEVILFFSGHGGPGFIVPTDIPNFLYYNDLKALFRKCRANEKIILLDACYSGGIRTKQESDDNNPSENHLPALSGSKEIVVFSSSRDDQTSGESVAYHGFFTNFLLQAFDGKADADGDGYVTFKELFDYVNAHVKDLSGGKQVPVMFGSFDPNKHFFRVAASN